MKRSLGLKLTASGLLIASAYYIYAVNGSGNFEDFSKKFSDEFASVLKWIVAAILLFGAVAYTGKKFQGIAATIIIGGIVLNNYDAYSTAMRDLMTRVNL